MKKFILPLLLLGTQASATPIDVAQIYHCSSLSNDIAVANTTLPPIITRIDAAAAFDTAREGDRILIVDFNNKVYVNGYFFDSTERKLLRSEDGSEIVFYGERSCRKVFPIE